MKMPALGAPVTTLDLARHGQSEWNNGRRVTGQLDPGLSDLGLMQSETLACRLRHEALEAIYRSALREGFKAVVALTNLRACGPACQGSSRILSNEDLP